MKGTFGTTFWALSCKQGLSIKNFERKNINVILINQLVVESLVVCFLMLAPSLTFPWTSSWCSSEEQRKGWVERWKTGSEKKQWKSAGQMCHSLLPNAHVETRGNLSCVYVCVCSSSFSSIFPQRDMDVLLVISKFSCISLRKLWYRKHTVIVHFVRVLLWHEK